MLNELYGILLRLKGYFSCRILLPVTNFPQSKLATGFPITNKKYYAQKTYDRSGIVKKVAHLTVRQPNWHWKNCSNGYLEISWGIWDNFLVTFFSSLLYRLAFAVLTWMCVFKRPIIFIRISIKFEILNHPAAIKQIRPFKCVSEIANAWPPCLRIIVTETAVKGLQVGTLFLVTYLGGSIGREGEHAVLIPDINISKVGSTFPFSFHEHSFFLHRIRNY